MGYQSLRGIRRSLENLNTGIDESALRIVVLLLSLILKAIGRTSVIPSKQLMYPEDLKAEKALHCSFSAARVLPAGVDVDFGAGSKLLRGAVALEEAGGAARPAPLGMSLAGRAAFRGGWSSVPKAEPAGGRQCVNDSVMKNGWTPWLGTTTNLSLMPPPASELDPTPDEWP